MKSEDGKGKKLTLGKKSELRSKRQRKIPQREGKKKRGRRR
jgi:hypothetical protein